MKLQPIVATLLRVIGLYFGFLFLWSLEGIARLHRFSSEMILSPVMASVGLLAVAAVGWIYASEIATWATRRSLQPLTIGLRTGSVLFVAWDLPSALSAIARFAIRDDRFSMPFTLPNLDGVRTHVLSNPISVGLALLLICLSGVIEQGLVRSATRKRLLAEIDREA